MAAQWLGLHTFTAKGTGSVPGEGTKILQSFFFSFSFCCVQHSQKKKKRNCYYMIQQFLSVLCACVLSCFSHVKLGATLWIVACQAPLSLRILQARIPAWVAISSSRGSSQPRDQIHFSYISCIGRRILNH